jgi:ABC-type sulfate/molybdate transport systems ATPase subunit
VLSRTNAGNGAIPVTVRHIRPSGAVVRLELDRVDEPQTIEAEVARERFLELALHEGDRAYVSAPSGPALAP